MFDVLKSLRKLLKWLFWIDIDNVIYLEWKYATHVQLLWLIMTSVHCFYNAEQV